MFAPAIGPTLAGIIVGALSWRFIFFSFALVLVVGIIFALKFEVNPYELTKPHLDVISVFAFLPRLWRHCIWCWRLQVYLDGCLRQFLFR